MWSVYCFVRGSIFNSWKEERTTVCDLHGGCVRVDGALYCFSFHDGDKHVKIESEKSLE